MNTDGLVKALDSLPSVLKKLKGSTNAGPPSSSTKRGRTTSTYGKLNESLEMSDIMRAHEGGADSHSMEHSVRVLHDSQTHAIDSVLSETAGKIVKNLAKAMEKERQEKSARDVQDVAEVAHHALSSLAKSESKKSIKDLCQSFDTNRTGRIVYTDFAQALNRAGSGISRVETDKLLSKIDPHKTGTINLGEIDSCLKSIQVTPRTSKSESPKKVIEKAELSEPLQSVKRPATEHKTLAPASSILQSAPKSPSGPQGRIRSVHADGQDVKALLCHERPRPISAPPSSRALRNEVNGSFDAKVFNEISPTKKEGTKMPIKDVIVSSDDIAPKTSQPITETNSSKENDSKTHTKVASKRGIIENSLCMQLGGRLTVLRHILKKKDMSNSGLVNKNEFEKALEQTGIRLKPKEAKQLFEMHSEKAAGDTEMGFTHGKAVSIDGFLKTLQSRITSPAFAHLAGETRPEQSKSTETIRAMKKVLRATCDQQNSAGVFNSLDPDNTGWVETSKLKEGLNILGSNLSESEFDVVLQRVDRNRTGRIQINEFDKVLHQEVALADNVNLKDKVSGMWKNMGKGSSNSLKSHEVLYTNGLDSYDAMSSAADHKKEHLRWDKLRSVFQNNKNEVLKAFGAVEHTQPSMTIHKRNEKLHFLHQPDLKVPEGKMVDRSVEELTSVLSKQSGINFGEEDKRRLQRVVKSEVIRDGVGAKADIDSSRVSLEKFCDIVGISIHEDAKGRVAASTINEPKIEDGIFQSSRHTLLGHQNYATTYALETSNYTPGFRKRSASPNQPWARSTDPSKFWEMENSTNRIWPTTGDPRASEMRRMIGMGRSASPAPAPASTPAKSSESSAVALSRWATQPLADFVAAKSMNTNNGRAASTGNLRHASNTEFRSPSTKSRLNLSGDVLSTPTRNLRRPSPSADRSRASPITGMPMHIQGGGGDRE